MTSDVRPIVVFTESGYYPNDLSSVFPSLGSAAELRRTEAVTPDELIRDLSPADITVVRRGRFTAEVFQNLPRLHGLVKWGVGVEQIDIPAATQAGVIVANSPGNSFAVAEATMLLIMAVAKNFAVMIQAAKAGIRPAFDVRGHELYEMTLGIIGFGRIGRHLAHIAQGFDMTVLAYDPYASADHFAAVGAGQVDLPTLLGESDYVSINCVLTPETHHLIGERELALMKPTAYLVNTARGPIVDERALYQALVEGRIAGAGLDVFEEEPLKPTNPLLALSNVVATPHALSRAWESTARTTRMIQDAVLAILDGRLPDTTLNPNVKVKGVQQ
jgi:phosphoglycerate dehydrogenase-like enzyme